MKYSLLLLLPVLYLSLFSGAFDAPGSSSTPPLSTKATPRPPTAKFDLTFDEIRSLPTVHYKLAFHFEANPAGENFTCNPEDSLVQVNSLLYASNYVYYVVWKMNETLEKALLIDGNETDANIRFGLVNEDWCASSYFYANGERPTLLKNAFNVVCSWDSPTDGLLAATNYGSNTVYVRNVINNLLKGEEESDNNFWDVARVILHEFGHTNSLKHSFNCKNPCGGVDIDVKAECNGNCYPTDSRSKGCFGGFSKRRLIMAYGIQLHFTPCETEQLWNYLLNNPRPYQYLDPCRETPGPDPIVYDTQDTLTWTGKKMFNKNVLIKAGTTIDARHDILMAPGKTITVESGGELFLNGGRIAELCGDERQGRVFKPDLFPFTEAFERINLVSCTFDKKSETGSMGARNSAP